MTGPEDGGLVSERIDEACDRFEREWKRGDRPRIEDHLAGVDGDHRLDLLVELIYLDSYYRRCADDLPTASEYALRFPELPSDRVAAAVEDTSRYADGRFRLLAQVGAGAFGVVWRALDTKLDRVVALKIPHAGPASGPDALERFRREAQAAAKLRHPGIGPVYDVAQVQGRPALVAEYIPGKPLSEVLSRRRPTPTEAAALVAALADALDYAHAMGAVHRDVKPGNVLVVPDPPGSVDSGMSALAGIGRPVLVDFGLALREGSGDATLTGHGQVLGTPAYMSPEQAAGQAHTADRRSDVYSLGVILYEMLTGRPPFQGERAAVVEQVRSAAPPAPRSVDRAVPLDLETVCLKAMAKDPVGRYRTAGALADDLRRFLRGEPVRARSPRAWERAYHWARRHPTATALLAVSWVAVAATAGVGLLAYHTRTLARANAAEAAQRRTAEAALYFNRVALASRELDKNNVGFVRQLLDECPADMRGWEWRYLKKRCAEYTLTFPHANPHKDATTKSVVAVAYSPDGRLLASASWDGLVNLWDADTGTLRRTLGESAGGMAVAFSPDGRSLVTGDQDGVLRVWDVATGRLAHEWRTGDPAVYAVAVSPDGNHIASGTGPVIWGADDAEAGKVVLWDAKTGARVHLLTESRQRVTAVAFRPDGRALAAAFGSWYNSPRSAFPGRVFVWELPGGQLLHKLGGFGDAVSAVAWSPDGKALATAGWDRVAQVFDAGTWVGRCRLGGHQDWVRGVAWAPDGRTLATVSSDSGVRVWDANTGRLARLFRGHTQAATAVAWRPDGSQVATAGSDGTIKIWARTSAPDPLVCQPFVHPPLGLTFHTRRDELLAAGTLVESPARLSLCGLDLRTGAVVSSAAFADASADIGEEGDRGDITVNGDSFALIRRRAELSLLGLPGGAVRWSASEPRGYFRDARFSPDGRTVVVVGYRDPTRPDSRHALLVSGWDTATGKAVPFERANLDGLYSRVAFHPSGRVIAVGCENRLTLWDVGTGRMLGNFPAHERVIVALEFSPDGSRLATASWDTTAKVWNYAAAPEAGISSDPVLVLRGHMRNLSGVAWEPNGARLATCSEDRTVKLWDMATGQEAVTFATDGDLLAQVVWSPDDRRIVAADRAGRVTTWDASAADDRE